MKILVPYIDADGRSLSSPIVTGGIERFIKDLVDCVPGVIPIELEKGLNHKKMTEAVAGAARKHDPDVILCNYPQNSLSGNLGKAVEKPIAWIVHHTAGFMSSLGSVGRIAEFSRGRGSVFFVSQYQEKQWRALADRMGAGEIKTSGYVVPSVVREKRKIISLADCFWDVSCVGRCEKKPDKDPFLCHYRFRDTDLSTCVMTNKKDNDYFRENQHWGDPDRDPRYAQRSTFYDLTHDKVLGNIATSRAFFVSWPDETFGITALEALSCGVPVICNAKKDPDTMKWSHAAECIPVKPEHMKLASTRKLDSTVIAAREFLKMGDDFRQEIADLTYERYCIDSWQRSIYNLCDQTIEADKKRTKTRSVMELFS